MRHHNRTEGLTGEHPFGDAVQLLLAILFFVVWVLDSFFLRYTVFLGRHIPLLLRVLLAIPVFFVAYRFASRSMALVFGGKGDPTAVLEEDVFAVMRHPMYFAALLLYVGFFLLTLSLASLALVGIALWFYDYIARHEERLLLKRFGKAYEEYMKRAPRWITPFRKSK